MERIIVTHSWILKSMSWNMMTGIMIATYPNVVSENLYSQVDSEVYQFLLLEEISDHRSYETSIAIADVFILI